MAKFSYRSRRHRRRSLRITAIIISITAVVVLGVTALILWQAGVFSSNGNSPSPSTSNPPTATATVDPTLTPGDEASTTPTPSAPLFTPGAVEGTRPANFGFQTAIKVGDQEVESYTRAEKIIFGLGETYPKIDGIVTFRGNNFRDSAAFGTAKMTEYKFDTNPWSIKISKLAEKGDKRTWDGSGWTGQPLIVRWPEETRKIMNLYEDKKNKDGLVEAIHATMDGHIYFTDIDDGKPTRDPLNLGMTFKGAGALDPRGYPLMYLGAGVDSNTKDACAFVVSLIDCKVLYEFGQKKDPFSLRTFHAYDSSPLVSAETDTLIYPGENGIIYSFKLNTNYDPQAGTISIDPGEMVRWRYITKRNNPDGSDQEGVPLLGIESSLLTWGEYAIFAENGGHLVCINLNTMETVWAQDVVDDTNCTPVLELEGDRAYVYISTSVRYGLRAKKGEKAPVPIWKIDAQTGEVIWEKTYYECYTTDVASGGAQGTLAIGKGSLKDLIFVPMAMTESTEAGGVIIALNKATGEKVWEHKMNNYSWSSPVTIYDQDGKGFLIVTDTATNVYLLDGLTGKVVDQLQLETGARFLEASPAVFENTIVIGTKSQMKIYGIKLK